MPKIYKSHEDSNLEAVINQEQHYLEKIKNGVFSLEDAQWICSQLICERKNNKNPKMKDQDIMDFLYRLLVSLNDSKINPALLMKIRATLAPAIYFYCFYARSPSGLKTPGFFAYYEIGFDDLKNNFLYQGNTLVFSRDPNDIIDSLRLAFAIKGLSNLEMEEFLNKLSYELKKAAVIAVKIQKQYVEEDLPADVIIDENNITDNPALKSMLHDFLRRLDIYRIANQTYNSIIEQRYIKPLRVVPPGPTLFAEQKSDPKSPPAVEHPQPPSSSTFRSLSSP